MLIGLKDLGDNTIQPGSPLLQGVLLLQSHFKVLLQSLDHTVFTLTHPGCLLLRGAWVDSFRVLLRFTLTSTQENNRWEGEGRETVILTDLYISEINPVEVREHLVDLG